ncbi:MAG: wax ester/triacylglycerol synthase family O-acyltransferase [Candidatus Binataceae bacterium]|jgi:WS/DGAT/MGAT family acyltransferase
MSGERIKLSALDASFLSYENTNTPMHTGVLMILSGPVSLTQIRDVIGRNVARMSRLTSRLEGDASGAAAALEPDSSFELGHHVRQFAMRAPYKTQQVADAAARVFAQALRRYRPLWEMVLLNGRDGGSALLGKLHHCVADGIAGVEVLEGLFASENGSTPLLRRHGRKENFGEEPRAEQSTSESASGFAIAQLMRWLIEPRAAGREIADFIRAATATAADVFDVAPALPFNGPVSKSRRIGWVELDLVALKAIKRHFGCTVNDVVLAIVAGGVRAYLRALGYQIRDHTLRTLVPFSLHRQRSGQRVGNQVSALVAPLPMAIADASRRLREIMRLTQELRTSGQARRMARATETVGNLAPGLLPILARLVCTRAVNLICSTVPGPRGLIRIAGRQVETVVPLVPLPDGIGLAFGAMNYAGRLCLGINADADLMTDLRPLMSGIRRAHAQLIRAAGTGEK